MITPRMSSMCCSGVFLSCWVTCLNDPLQSKLMTLPPASLIQLREMSPSTKPRISTLWPYPRSFAQDRIFFAPWNSPADTLAEATSIRSTPTSSNKMRATLTFSVSLNATPDVCSPSRSVVSMMVTHWSLTFTFCPVIVLSFQILLSHPLG